MVAHSMQCTSTSDTASIVRLAQVASHQVRVCNTVDDLHKHWCCKDVLGRLRHSQIRDPVLDVLAFVLKALLERSVGGMSHAGQTTGASSLLKLDAFT